MYLKCIPFGDQIQLTLLYKQPVMSTHGFSLRKKIPSASSMLVLLLLFLNNKFFFRDDIMVLLLRAARMLQDATKKIKLG
jgi:hypothetical protein